MIEIKKAGNRYYYFSRKEFRSFPIQLEIRAIMVQMGIDAECWKKFKEAQLNAAGVSHPGSKCAGHIDGSPATRADDRIGRMSP
ncbi:hypothetical protein LJK88_14055 [Paenibacillus sp. P26]|nr:hypothetical protein LJK88_14055 [Paenibacillus sp. P26]UUZ96965.1 hypothetical protein LJK87_23690 [Paenibacillus sp. P25]